MKTIRIFIGSSITDLELERFKLMSFIQGLNNKYHERGVFIEGYICEETPNTMRLGGSQEQHNDYISNESDLTVFMFFHKAGEFTLKELQLAREAFLRQGRPNVCVFFKAVNKAPDLNEDIQRAVRLVFEDYGHYYKVFEDVDTVKLEILQFLADLLPGKSELLVKDGAVFVNGEAVEGISAANVFAYRNNPDLARLKEKIDRLREQEVQAAGQGNESAALRFSKLRDNLEKEYHDLETGILDMLLFFHRENRKSGKSDPVLMEALRYLELGEIEMAKALLPQEELDRLAESLAGRRELAEAALREDSETLLARTRARVRTLEMDTGNPGRFEEIRHAYENAYETARSANGFSLLTDYVGFLYSRKDYAEAARVAKATDYLLMNPDLSFDDVYPRRDLLLDLMSMIYGCAGDPENEETVLLLNLEQRRLYFRKYPTPHNEYRVAELNRMLASFYLRQKRMEEAEQYHLETVEGYRRAAKTVDDPYRDMYENSLAIACSNTGLMYDMIGKPEEAERFLREALEVCRGPAERRSSPSDVSDLVMIVLNLYGLYAGHGKTNAAETLLREALETVRRLGEKLGPDVCEPNEASLLYNMSLLFRESDPARAAECLREAAVLAGRRRGTDSTCAWICEQIEKA